MRYLIHIKIFLWVSLALTAGLFLFNLTLDGKSAQALSMGEEESWIIRWESQPPALFYESSEVISEIEELNITFARPKQGQDHSAWLKKWKESKDVEYIQFNHRMEISAVPNDPLFESQEYLKVIGAVPAWEYSTGSEEVTVAVVDTGIDLEHPDLKEMLIEGVNLLDSSKAPQDDNGHGTQLAGILAAVANNDQGISGLLWNAKIMPVKALGSNGLGDEAKLGEGIKYAVDHGADIVVLALGLHHYSPYLKDIVDYAEQHDVLLVAAAGNEGGEVKYPAAFPTVLAVGGIGYREEIVSRSNFGPEVDVVAPWNVFTTQLLEDYGPSEGTSMAAPQVAGAAALIKAKYPDLKAYQIRHLIRQSAKDISAPGWDEFTGHGLLQIDQALKNTDQKDMFEPNDVQAQSTRLPVSAEIKAELSHGADLDWYTLANRYPGQVKVTLITEKKEDLSNIILEIADADGNLQKVDHLSEEVIMKTAGDGAFLRVSAKQPDNNVAIPYRIQTEFFMDADPFEDNDEKYKAFVLPAREQTIRGTFHQPNDEDWFTLYIEKKGTLKLKVYTDTNRIDSELTFQRDNEKPMVIDWGSDGETEYSGNIEVEPGKYYIRIRNYNAKEAYPVAGYYFLHVEYNQAFSDPHEPNQDASQAIKVEENTAYQGVIDQDEDEDWFTFTLEKESIVNFGLSEIPKDRMMSLKLLDAEQNQLSIDINLLGYDRIDLEKVLQPGTYYIRLSANQPFNYQMYSLRLSSDVLVAGYRDIYNHWAEEWIVDLKEKGLMEGYDHHYFHPGRSMSRAEAAMVIAKMVKDEVPTESDINEKRIFTDVSEDHWAYEAIHKAAEAGIFHGYPDGTFKPERILSRVEMTVLIAQLMGMDSSDPAEPSPFSDVSEDHWAYPYIIFMQKSNWLSGYPDGSFKPNRIATRAEFASFISRFINSERVVNE